ncbi:hypothetical protein BK133_24825 [Paenibacillus sp. FSL H8-0548]|uniref:Ger(x)C family spore germination protein n=1 Tax=Paenibacillus sp. FSL H8-0548 TaxID=1920422 RepID=UPI00096FAAB3|nr:Ger(x)C family spore germination protein [Paenibacillus sp. FSL H8-0548]OMF23069.1 hypothetical protein BK133_24825 [Paenibacillus sp. FSL H8-0548]
MKWEITALKIMLILLCSASLSGCWNRIELDELAITSATSIDRKGDDWVVSFQVVIPSSISSGIGITGGGAGAPINVYSTVGKTIRDANSKSFFESPRKLYFAHNRVIIVSEETARRGMNPIFDVYLRNSDARETVNVLVTPGSSRKILEQMMQLRKISGDAIREINMLEAEEASVLPVVKMYQLAMNLTSDSASALLPEVFIAGNSDASSLKVFESTTLPAKVKLGRVAVLKKDRMVGWLSREEALGVAFIKNDVKKTTLTFGCPNDSTKHVTALLDTSRTKLIPTLKDGKISVKVDIKGKTELTQSDCSAVDYYKPEVISELEKAAEQDIIRYTEAGWKAVQRLNTDAVGFADLAHRKYRKQWQTWKQDWDAVFSEIEIKVAADIKMSNVGLANQPINMKKIQESQ